MATYVSILNWSGEPQPTAHDVRAAVAAQREWFRSRGLHSLVFLPDEGECAAIMVSNCARRNDPEALAQDILPAASLLCETMRFDDPPAASAALQRPRPPQDFSRALLRAIAGAA